MIGVLTQVVGSPPWADFAFTGLPAGSVACLIYREDDGAWTLLPGASRRSVLGDEWRFIDHGFPVSAGAQAVNYRIDPVGSDGSVITAGVFTWSVASVTTGHSEGWLSDPLDPLGAVRVTVEAAGDSLGWGNDPVQLLRPAAGLPMSSTTTRDSVREWSVSTESAAVAGAVRNMIADGGVLLLRGDPDCLVHPTGVIYMEISNPSMSWDLVHEAYRSFGFNGTEVRPPAILQTVASRTYADDLAEHPTYEDSTAAFGTYLERTRG